MSGQASMIEKDNTGLNLEGLGDASLLDQSMDRSNT